MRTAVLTLLGISAVAVLTGCGDRRSPTTSSSSKLVFAWPDPYEHPDKSAIYLADANGTHAKELAKGAYPVLAPDGNYVAYKVPTHALPPNPDSEQLGDLTYNEYVIAASGGDPIKLSDAKPTIRKALAHLPGTYDQELQAQDRSASPNGKQVAYVRGLYASDSFLYVRSNKGGHPRRLARTSGSIFWSREGIIYRTTDSHGKFGTRNYRATQSLWIIRANGSGKRRLLHAKSLDDLAPVWASKRGDRVLLASLGCERPYCAVLDLRQDKILKLNATGADLGTPPLSKDGRYVLLQTGSNETASIRMLPVDGGDAKTLVPHGASPSWNR